MNLLFTYPETIVDGEGIRYSIYLAGCRHRIMIARIQIHGIHRQALRSTPEKIEKMICEINTNPLLDGICFSGGIHFIIPRIPGSGQTDQKKLPDKHLVLYWIYI